MSLSSQSSMSIIGLPNDVTVTKAVQLRRPPKPAQLAEKTYIFSNSPYDSLLVTRNIKEKILGWTKKSLVFLDEERSREVIANEDHGMMIMLANADENQE